MANRVLKDNKKNNICPMRYTMNILSGKWKLVILWYIYDYGTIRYGELKRQTLGITHKMLSKRLSELIDDNIIKKKIYEQIPPKVEYSLTEHGKTLIPIMESLVEWGKKNWH